MIKIKKYSTIDVTFRQLSDGDYIIIAHHHSWIKSHAINVAYPYPDARGIKLSSIGLCFQYVKKYMSNARCKHELDAPLARSDYYYSKIHQDEMPVSYKED